MKGIFLGDILGSPYQFSTFNNNYIDLLNTDTRLPPPSFTDDTLLTISVMEHLLRKNDILDSFKNMFQLFPHAGWGQRFAKQMLFDDSNDSYGNGCIMRILPVSIYYRNLKDALKKAEEITITTHNSEEAILATQILVELGFKINENKENLESIISNLEDKYQTELNFKLSEIIGNHKDANAINTLKSVIPCLLESENFESVIKNAIIIGGDTDTRGAIAGGLAEIYYKDKKNQDYIYNTFEYVSKWDDLFISNNQFLNIVDAFYEEII